MVLVIIFCVVLGAVLGSFSCCQAWRIRYKVEKKGELGKRSVCLSCGKKLRWYENMPIVSWVLQRGKCRKCGKKIGTAEIMSEVLGGVFGGMVGVKFLDKIMTGELGDGITKLLFYGNTAVLGTAELWLMITEILLIVVIFTHVDQPHQREGQHIEQRRDDQRRRREQVDGVAGEAVGQL